MFKKVFWALALIGSTSILLFNLIHIISTYFSYGVNLQVKTFRKAELEFPAVTVCNINPIRKSTLKQHPHLSAIMNKYSTQENSQKQEGEKRRKRDIDTEGQLL